MIYLWRNKMRKSTKRLVGIIVLLLLISLPASAEDVKENTSDVEEKEWEFLLVPYLWFTGIDGDVTVKGREANVDVSFDELLENLDLGLLSHFIAKRGRWEFFVQPNYMKLSADGEVEGKIVRIDADVETGLLFLEFGTFYRLGTRGNRLPVSLDILGGGRYWHVDNKIDLDIDISLPRLGIDGTRERDADSDKDLIDPFVGLRFETSVAKKLRFKIRGDIGGFDISDDTSDLSWQAVGLFEYDISERIILGAGYRALDIRYETGSRDDKNGIDATIHGPILGIGFRF